jgi:transcriptional regulator with XRE-family HTH domain
MPKPDPREFGKQIARLRKARGLSQVDLADASGVPITAIRRCEQNGRIPLDRYLILATALNASLKIVPSTPTDGSIPDRLPYKSIQDIIREAAQRPATQPASEIRKPRLGGMFDTMATANSARS